MFIIHRHAYQNKRRLDRQKILREINNGRGKTTKNAPIEDRRREHGWQPGAYKVKRPDHAWDDPVTALRSVPGCH